MLNEKGGKKGIAQASKCERTHAASVKGHDFCRKQPPAKKEASSEVSGVLEQ